MTATTLNRALERMGFNGKDTIGFSAHGFRATASTILNEIGFRPDVIERQLAHADRNKVRASYNQAQYLEERRAMMQQWADLIDVWSAPSWSFAREEAGTSKSRLRTPCPSKVNRPSRAYRCL
jgi:hypothetical protein